MSREEIREARAKIDFVIEEGISDAYKAGKYGTGPIKTIEAIKKRLKLNLTSQGVVLKVEKECKHVWRHHSLVMDTNPPIRTKECCNCHEMQSTGLDGEWHLCESAWSATESLIEEK